MYNLHLLALSPSLPIVSSHFVDVFKNTSPFFKATYIVARVEASGQSKSIYSRALRYPICGRAVFKIICRLVKDYELSPTPPIKIPRRLFRSLLPANGREWSDEDYPLPFLRDIYCTPNLPLINVDANEGYALAKAVHAQFIPLVKFLLAKGASPMCHDGKAVKIAIRLKDFDMFKMLVEWPQSRSGKIKCQGRQSTILDSSMMGIAISSGASDIIEFFQKKGVVPDIVALSKLVMC